MFKSRGLNILFIFMLIVIIGAISAYFVVSNNAQDSVNVKDPNIDQIVNDLTVSTGEITTNIKGDHFIKISFNIQVSNKDARDELNKRSFQVKNAVIYAVSGMTPHQIQDQQGIANLENQVRLRINGFLKNGHVVHVYTTEKIVQ
ncbi:MAG: flagellar basal body-associated FliL family protein [Sporolactobacillus sp.]